MATATVHAANVHFSADRHIARWRPLVLTEVPAVPHRRPGPRRTPRAVVHA